MVSGSAALAGWRANRASNSPELITPHKARNGEHSITCRDRHCPRCQSNARDRWIDARSRELLPTPYVHVVFTLPHELAPLALQNKKIVYDLLFRISAETLLQIARDPKHLGADIGFFSVLHSWNQKLEHHPHVHCVVRPAAYTQTARAGLRRMPNSSFLWMFWLRCSGASSMKR